MKMDVSTIVQAFNRMQVPMLIVQQDGEIIQSNDAASQLLGCKSLRLEGQQVEDFLVMPTTFKLDSITQEGHDKTVIQDIRAQHFKGFELLLSVQFVAWKSCDNRLYFTLILNEITGEMADLDRARVDSDLAVNAIENAQMGVFTLDLMHDEVTLSTIWYELMGLNPNEPIDFRSEWNNRIHPEDRPRADEKMKPCIEGLQEQTSYTCRIRSKDDSCWLWMGVKISISKRDDTGKVIQIIGMITDITERKIVENSRFRAEKQFKSAYESAVVGMAVTTIDGSFLSVNPALCKLMGYSEDQLLSAGCRAFTHSEDLEESQRQMALLRDGQIPNFQFEKRYVRANGSTMWALVSVGVVRNTTGDPEQFVAQVLDITEQRRLAQLKTEFVSTVSHELRTPLTSVLGALEILSSLDEEELSDKASRLLCIALKNGKRLHSLINDVLDFEKFSSGKVNLDLSCQNISQLVDDAVLTNTGTADEFGVHFVVDCPDQSVTGFVDEKRVQQVMTNLLTNAAKFADEGTTIDISIEGQPDFVKVSIANEGLCIPEAFHDQIFKPFAQVAATATRKREGTGLGLKITQQIVEQSGGEIDFRSAEGEKTTFWFTLPVNAEVVRQSRTTC